MCRQIIRLVYWTGQDLFDACKLYRCFYFTIGYNHLIPLKWGLRRFFLCLFEAVYPIYNVLGKRKTMLQFMCVYKNISTVFINLVQNH